MNKNWRAMEQAISECIPISRWHWLDVMQELKRTVQLFDNVLQSSGEFVIVHARHNCEKHKSVRMVEWYFVPDYEGRIFRAMKCWLCTYFSEE